MKKIFLLVLCFLFTIFMYSCTNNPNGNNNPVPEPEPIPEPVPVPEPGTKDDNEEKPGEEEGNTNWLPWI